ncbi:MAG: NADH-quinone oxidoreductase subunit C [Chloroflexia bacterium]|nr:NADH-quinone oxidoreductase subunit C [Chloroflexia bacterium]
MTVAELALRERIESALPPGTIQQVQENGDLQIDPERLLELGHYLREQEGLDYLSSISGVDWPEQGEMEVVYHLFAMRRGARLAAGGEPAGLLGPIVLKVRVPRDEPVVPSLVEVWKGALWQERETYDMLGLRFAGHPDLRRIYLWDEFAYHPLRKDYEPEEAQGE